MKEVNVAAAIIQKDGKILCCQRGYGEFKGGWEFPGGKLEPGETGEQAAVREIREELEIAIGDLEYLCTIEHDYPSFHLTMSCYLATYLSGKLHENAHEDIKWLDPDDLRTIDWLPADIKVVDELERKLA